MMAMKSWSFLLALLLLTVPATGFCQLSITIGSKDANLLTPGLPFQAERVTRTESHLGNGTIIRKELHEAISRDFAGRIFDEFQVVSRSDAAEPAERIIADPIKSRYFRWTVNGKTVSSMSFGKGAPFGLNPLSPDRHATPQLAKDKTIVSVKDLGTRVIAGMVATGTRTVTTIQPGAVGNDSELVTKHEVWFSDELKIVMLESDESPFTGMRSSEITSLNRNMPQAALFKLPDGVVVKELNVFGGLASLLHLDLAAYGRALNDIQQPELREKAADQLLEYAKTHAESQNHIAHVLAARNIRLSEADSLGEQSVNRLEQETSALALEKISASDFETMELLAEYWDTLGWIRYTQGKVEEAKRYCRIAWEVGGEGLYIGHVARVAVKENDNASAIHELEVAMSGKMDEREKSQTANDLRKLGVEHPQPIFEPTVLHLPAKSGVPGKADFDLLFTANAKPQLKWVGGDPALSRSADALANAVYPPQIPDDGPEHVIRRGILECSRKTCTLTLVFAWQADQPNDDQPH